ncbi:NAD(P)-dependent oxidoreductase [Acidianus sulfidivorans]|nr:NAD(P)-dependent oxidoreductase [Acidianus sulfidivorans]
MKVGVVGLGLMGSRIAKNFAKDGLLTAVWNRTEEKAIKFSKEFGIPYIQLENLPDYADAIILVLSDDNAVTNVIKRLLPKIKGKILIDMSTITPEVSIELATLIKNMGGLMYDAPLTGSVGIEERKATVMVGGPKEKSEEVVNLLKHTANNVLYIGENGSGLFMKLVNNLLASSYMTALAEAYSLGIKAGLKAEKITEFLSNYSIVSSPLSKLKCPKIEQNNFEPQFSLKLMTKDLRIINKECENLGVTNFISSLVLKLHELALKNNLENLDMSAIYLLYK